MGSDTGKALGRPAIILVGIGAILDVILFYFMFKFADEQNLFMVLLTAALIGIVALGITKGLVSISRRNYDK
jgi:ribose/xylose/arabinose/galactoside ABC-type transport system permease subunit